MTLEHAARNQASLLARIGEQQTALILAEETLRQQRLALDELLEGLQTGEPGVGEETADGSRNLRADNEELRLRLAAAQVELEKKEKLLAQQRGKPAPQAADRDVDSLEAELTDFRRQLEADRQKLDMEIEQVRARNQELDEATREMELEMSRERAEFARERQRLERLRDDVRLELERIQRDGGLRDRLTPVTTLRDQINQRRNPGSEPVPRQTPQDAMQERIRALRTKVNEQ